MDTGYKCDVCGRFMSPGSLGTSWSIEWTNEGGYPELHEPEWRCSPCTDKEGVKPTNCAPAYRGNGRVTEAPTHD